MLRSKPLVDGCKVLFESTNDQCGDLRKFLEVSAVFLLEV